MKDRSPDAADRKYFVLAPHIVWARSRNAYDIAAWATVMMIAGEDGECTLGNADLARLAGMSAGKFADCRAALIKAGLLQGYIHKDGRYNAVWHLRVPNLWPANSEFRNRAGDALYSRIAAIEAERASVLHRAGDRGDAEPQDSPGERDHSPGERDRSPGERDPSPGESKKNPIEPKEEPEEEGGEEPTLITFRALAKPILAATLLPRSEETTYDLAGDILTVGLPTPGLYAYAERSMALRSQLGRAVIEAFGRRLRITFSMASWQ